MTIDGFTITNSSTALGAAASSLGSVTLNLTNCALTGNDFGIRALASSSGSVTLILTNNTISGNNAIFSRAGVFIGTSRAGISSLDQTVRKIYEREHRGRSVSPYLMPSTTGSMAASAVAQRNGLKGECIGFSNACASGLVAIGNAVRSIRHGYSDIVIAGGADAPVCPLPS